MQERHDGPWGLLDLTGRRALVTGASRGIGAAIAAALAAAGAEVVAGGRSFDERPATATPVAGDLSTGHGARQLVADAVDVLGGLDVLVNNAAQQPVTPLTAISDEEWSSVFDVNARAVFSCTQEAARTMPPGAAVVNIASIEASSAFAGHAHYAASKAAVVRLTQAAAAELGPRGIRVNAVSPGLIWRDGIDEQWPEGVERWRSAAPLGTLGSPEDVANAVLFLASPAARWITGTSLTVDGGVTATPSW